jgi:hypothetical protein
MEVIDMTGFFVGLVIGTFVGVLVMCLCFAARGDGNMPDIEEEE